MLVTRSKEPDPSQFRFAYYGFSTDDGANWSEYIYLLPFFTAGNELPAASHNASLCYLGLAAGNQSYWGTMSTQWVDNGRCRPVFSWFGGEYQGAQNCPNNATPTPTEAQGDLACVIEDDYTEVKTIWTVGQKS